jgi:hypothetical protein
MREATGGVVTAQLCDTAVLDAWMCVFCLNAGKKKIFSLPIQRKTNKVNEDEKVALQPFSLCPCDLTKGKGGKDPLSADGVDTTFLYENLGMANNFFLFHYPATHTRLLLNYSL